MATYKIELDNDTLKVGFGEPATNCEIVRDAAVALTELQLQGGQLLKVTGSASMPAAFVLAHGTSHLYGAIAVFDPKLSAYVVVVTHDPNYKLGDLIAG